MFQELPLLLWLMLLETTHTFNVSIGRHVFYSQRAGPVFSKLYFPHVLSTDVKDQGKVFVRCAAGLICLSHKGLHPG